MNVYLYGQSTRVSGLLKLPQEFYRSASALKEEKGFHQVSVQTGISSCSPNSPDSHVSSIVLTSMQTLPFWLKIVLASDTVLLLLLFIFCFVFQLILWEISHAYKIDKQWTSQSLCFDSYLLKVSLYIIYVSNCSTPWSFWNKISLNALNVSRGNSPWICLLQFLYLKQGFCVSQAGLKLKYVPEDYPELTLNFSPSCLHLNAGITGQPAHLVYVVLGIEQGASCLLTR